MSVRSKVAPPLRLDCVGFWRDDFYEKLQNRNQDKSRRPSEPGGLGRHIISWVLLDCNSRLLDFPPARPEVKRKRGTGESESCAEFGCVPESLAGIADKVIKDSRDKEIVTGMEQRRRPQAIRLQPKPR